MYVVILLCLRQYMVLQILLVTLQSIFQMMWIGAHHPYSVRRNNNMTLVNEYVILVVTSLLLVASDSSIGSYNRSALGYAVNVVVSLTILGN